MTPSTADLVMALPAPTIRDRPAKDTAPFETLVEPTDAPSLETPTEGHTAPEARPAPLPALVPSVLLAAAPPRTEPTSVASATTVKAVAVRATASHGAASLAVASSPRPTLEAGPMAPLTERRGPVGPKTEPAPAPAARLVAPSNVPTPNMPTPNTPTPGAPASNTLVPPVASGSERPAPTLLAPPVEPARPRIPAGEATQAMRALVARTGTQVVVQLEPEHLGRVTLRLAVTGTTPVLHADVASDAAFQALRADPEILLAPLRQHANLAAQDAALDLAFHSSQEQPADERGAPNDQAAPLDAAPDDPPPEPGVADRSYI